MLRKISVENFYSIADVQTLDLRIAKNVPDPAGRFSIPIQGMGERFPKVVAVFGPNASGKTTLLRSIAFLASFVRDSADWSPDQPFPYLPFASAEWSRRNTTFFAEFDAQVRQEHDRRIVYHYELEIDVSNSEIIHETLKYYPSGRPRRLFERNKDGLATGRDFELSLRDPVRQKIRKNASVISTLAKFNHPFSLDFFKSLRSVQTNVPMVGELGNFSEDGATRYYIRTPECFRAINDEISRFDLGIESLHIRNTENGSKPFFSHRGIDRDLSYIFESRGTKTFYKLFPLLYYVLKEGGLAILDEIDNDIHPLLIPEFIDSFHSSEKNPLGGQIIMSCHSPSLLEYLYKEEVFFTEKNGHGATEIYSLKDIQGLRRDTNLYAKYLAGAFGAIPKVG